MRFRKLLLLPVCAFLFASCGETQSDDEMQSDAGFKEGIYIKEGTYQKKDSKEKILIIDQSHLQLSDMDFQALIDHYKIAYSDFGWKPDENTIKMRSKNHVTTKATKLEMKRILVWNCLKTGNLFL